MFDLVTLGELLIDFTFYGKSENGMSLFEQNPGGAPANMICAAANLGLKTAFIGKVGKDMHGDYLRRVLDGKNVNTDGLISSEEVFTTLAFVELSEKGERKFSFARKPGADTCLLTSDVNITLLENCKIFHFGSLSLTDEPSRSATIEAVKTAKKAGAIISFDPNYREPLWKSGREASENIQSLLYLADIVKISDDEIELITGETSPETAANCLLQKGIACVVVTLGKKGAYAAVKDEAVHICASDVTVVDTTGAGDAFWGGFLYKLAVTGLPPRKLGKMELKDFTEFANSVASICVQKRGGIPAMPAMCEVEELIRMS